MSDEPTVNLSASYLGGMEKARVREQCWLPLLKSRKTLTGRRIKFLTLPGRQLTEIKALIDVQNGPIIEGLDDLIFVECEIMDYYTVLKEAPLLPYLSRVEPAVVIYGDINDLLLKDKLNKFLPFDAVNLDYCGFFWGTDNIASTKWNAVKHLIEVQSRSGLSTSPHPFTLLLTVQGRGDGSTSISDTLQGYKDDVGEQWNQIASYPYHGKLVYALPLMLIHVGYSLGYEVRCTHRYVYQPSSVGGRAKMLTFGFTFDVPAATSDTMSTTKQLFTLEQTHCTEVLITKPVHLIYNVQTQELREDEFDPTSS